jgi:hypothetical protein
MKELKIKELNKKGEIFTCFGKNKEQGNGTLFLGMVQFTGDCLWQLGFFS